MSTKKSQSLIQLLLIIGILIFVNILGNAFYTYFDWTEEKRFTLTDSTTDLLKELDEVVYVQVLFGGQFPAGIKRLQTSVREILDDFRSESPYIEYEFVDPFDAPVEEVNKQIEELKKDNIVPMLMRFKEVEETTEKQAFPYAIFHYKGRKMSVNFFENAPTLNPDENINNAVALLEYKFANAIEKLQRFKKPIVLFTAGQGELHPYETIDLEKTLEQFYEVERVNLDSIINIPAEEVACLVIAKPRFEFSEKKKFILDQYVMNGGRVLWLIDKLNVSIDSIGAKGKYIPPDYNLNLDDLFFKYGFRINADLVLDLQNSKIPLAVDAQGKIDLFNYFYHPVITPQSTHPVVKSLDNLNLFFANTIDTIRTKTPVKKSILLQSSNYSRIQFSPVTLDFEILRYDPQPEKFNKGPQNVAVLLEGTFSSLYANRVNQSFLNTLQDIGQDFREESIDTRMLVVSDGDIAVNFINRQRRDVRPAGFNRYEGRLYANKPFLINAIEYLINDTGVIEARGKEVKLRLLDSVRARNEKTKWQLINIALPLAFLVLFGLGYNWWRKRSYESVS